MDNSEYSFNNLLETNHHFIEQYQQNSLMLLIKSHKVGEKNIRSRLLSAIQTFSNYFQKTVMLRYVLNDNNRFNQIITEHLKEEFLHNEALLADRNHAPPKWDPTLEATSSWFTWKMLTSNDEEKTMLMHLVLEASANIFFREINKIMQKFSETNFFAIHSELDDEHEKMGLNLLENLAPKQYQQLLIIQQQGWEMAYTACDRMAFLAATTHI